MKDIALLMTMGTGIGKPEEIQDIIDSLAYGFLFSIEWHRPKKVVFFGSDKSRVTLESLKRQYFEKYNKEFDIFEYVEINEIDSFNKYFNGIKNKIHELNEEYDIIIDYTSGTKTMTMSASLASMVFRKKLSLFTGERVNGIVKKGTESVFTQNLYPVYDELMLEKVRELFNSNRFESGKILLNDVIDSQDKELYSKLFDIYYNFDIVNYDNAYALFSEELLNEIRNKWPDLAQKFSENRQALDNMKKLNPKLDLGKKPWKNKKYRIRCYYILASLINNAKRRYSEGKYDDAIARLYRSLELIAQIRLREKYNISTSNVDLDTLKNRGLDKNHIDELINCLDLNDNIKIGLAKDYDLLFMFSDDLGIFYAENASEISRCLEYRNKSILAHGLNFQTKNQYLKFEELVLEAGNILTNDLNDYLDKTKFPKFEQV